MNALWMHHAAELRPYVGGWILMVIKIRQQHENCNLRAACSQQCTYDGGATN